MKKPTYQYKHEVDGWRAVCSNGDIIENKGRAFATCADIKRATKRHANNILKERERRRQAAAEQVKGSPAAVSEEDGDNEIGIMADDLPPGILALIQTAFAEGGECTWDVGDRRFTALGFIPGKEDGRQMLCARVEKIAQP